MQSYFGSIQGDDNLPLLDPQVVDSNIARSLDVSGTLTNIAITESCTSGNTLESQNSFPNVPLCGDEDVFMCGICKQQFIDLRVFLQHKKEGCIGNHNITQIVHSQQQQHVLPSMRLPDPPVFQNVRRANVVLPTLTGSLNASQSFPNNIEATGLNLSQNTHEDRNTPSDAVRDAAQTSGICGNSALSSAQANATVNMNDMNGLVQLHNSCGLMQPGAMPVNSRSLENIVIADDMLVNSSTQNQTIFNTDNTLDRCYQEGEVNQQIGNFVNVIGGVGMSPLLQQIPATFQQPLSSFNNTQQVYIHIQPQPQLETQTTYSLLPKNTSMNYAVGLNLSTLHVAQLPVNNTTSTPNFCSTQDGNFAPHTVSMQDNSKMPDVLNKDDFVTQITSTMQPQETVQTSNPTINVQKKIVSKKVFTCQYCRKSFSKTFDLEQHVRSHTGEKPFQCIVCGRAFAQKSNVRKHMETHKVWPKEAMEIMPIMVVHPNSTIGNNSGTDSSKTAANPPTYPSFPKATRLCPYCNQPLGSYNERKTHMLRHKDKQVYKCVSEGCEQTFSDLDDYVDHVKTHEGSIRYRCHHCHKLFDSLHDIGVHQYQEHLNDKSGTRRVVKHQCKLCPAKFTQAELLQRHMMVESHKHLCNVCGKQFSCENYLHNHTNKMHSETPRKKYKCEQCGKYLNSVYYLQSHLLIHTKEKPFKCQICDAGFNRKDKLVRHMVTHDPNKKYKCPFRETMKCMKEFNRPDKLKAHIISHNGIKAHQCSFCPKRFTRRNIKLAHEKTHSFKPICVKCGKTFKNQPLLDTHKCRHKSNQKSSPGDKPQTSDAVRDDLLSLPEGPMYAIRSGSKRKHLRRNVSRPDKALGKKAELMKSNVEVNITARTVPVDETDVDVEGDH